MPKCPRCEKEIELLSNFYSVERHILVLVGGGVQTQRIWESENIVKGSERYECSFCHEVLFTDGEEADKFLLGR